MEILLLILAVAIFGAGAVAFTLVKTWLWLRKPGQGNRRPPATQPRRALLEDSPEVAWMPPIMADVGGAVSSDEADEARRRATTLLEATTASVHPHQPDTSPPTHPGTCADPASGTNDLSSWSGTTPSCGGSDSGGGGDFGSSSCSSGGSSE